MKRRNKYKAGIIAMFVTLALVSSVYAKPVQPQEQSNVLFIVLDTCRADHLGCYGYDKIKTPRIDGLAARGVRFDSAISQVPLTCASHASMFTSTYPQYNKVRDNGSFSLEKSYLTLAEILKDNGYATSAFVSSIVLDSRYGLDQGFDTYDDTMPKRKKERIIKFMDEERTADQVTQAAANWLKENKGKKFFVWAHYYDPHTVYNPPEPYKETYRDNLYDGEIAFADEQIGKLLDVLKELGEDTKTLVIFCSDHGEGLGEHGESGHAVFIYDSTLRVPLILVRPGFIPQGKVVPEQVRLIDIMPTVLDILGLPGPKETQGASLLGLVSGRQKSGAETAYSESNYANYHFNWGELKSWRTPEWKYIKSPEPELYDLKNDSHELTNLVKEKADIARRLDRDLESFLQKTTSEKKEKKIQVDQEAREKLMSLGYMTGSLTPAKEPVPIKMVRVMEKMNLSDRQANAGLLDQAIAGYFEVIGLDPGNMEAYLHLAQCYKGQQKYDQAIKYFKKAASFKPDEPQVHNGLGTIYKDMGRVEEAFKEFKLAQELDPDDPATITNIGWYYQQKLQVDKALENYRAALKLDNEIATTHANMAILYRIKGNLDKAMEEVNIAIKLDPELSFAYAELCACIATKGDIDKAIPYCQKATELNPRGLEGYNNLAVCYERQGEYDKALENYLKVQEIAPWNCLAYCNISKIYMQRKDFEKAKEYLKKALQINPNCPKAPQLLEAISQHSR